MGAAVSGFSCREHGGRLQNVDCNDVSSGARCGVCQHQVQVGKRVRRCRKPGCAFVLHDECFRLPAKVKHFAHPQHRLTLCAVGGAQSLCRFCALNLEAHTYEYSCAEQQRCATGGFRLHRRCCNLPQTIYNTALHPHGRLHLRSPSDGNGGNDGSVRRCLKCNQTTTRRTTAWSYRCRDTNCNDKEICLRCVLGNEDLPSCGCVPGCGDVDPGLLGKWIGNLFCGIGYGMGLPCFRAPAARR